MARQVDIFAEAAELYRDDPEGLAEALHAFDPISWITWTRLLNEKGEPIEFRDHMPLKQIYRDMHPNQATIKGAQIGMTETVINKLLWYGDNHNITAIYTMPTATHVSKFSQSRFSPVIKKNPYLRARMKKSVDNIELKSIGNSWIHFGGAQKENQAISTPADILVHDEWDFSDPDVLDTYGKRTLASQLDWKWRFSTPTLPGYGIDAEFTDTDQRVWIVKCDRCNHYQEIGFFTNIFRNRHGVYYFGCERCKKRLRRRAGFWMAKFPERATDAEYDKAGNIVVPATGKRGYYVNPLAFTFIDANKKMESFTKAEKSNKPTQKKNFYNFELGVPYSSAENNLTVERILETMSPQFARDGYNVMGVDQGDNKHYVIKHISPSGFRPVIKFGVVQDWELIKKLFWEYECRVGVTDALPNKDSARKLVQTMKKRFWMAYYAEQHADLLKRIETEGNVKDKDIWAKNYHETQAINIDRTESLDETIQFWIDGLTYLVANPESRSPEVDEFVAHLRGMKRDIRANSKGIERAVWIRVKPDHWLHADNFANIASKVGKGRGNISDLSVGGNMGGIAVPNFDVYGETMEQRLMIPQPPTMAALNFRDW